MGEALHTAAWDEMSCVDCESTLFVKVYSLRRSQTGGTVEKLMGWRCVACQATADVAAMIRATQLKQKRSELEQLERELRPVTSRRASTH